LEEGLGFVEEELGAAGLAEELEGAAGARDVLLHLDDVARVRGEHEEFAVGQLVVEGFGELKAALLGHGDIAEKETGDERSRASQAVGCRVDGFGFIAVDFEDQIESVGYQVVIVDDQYTLFHETPRALLR
jgi:hypothetical protein